MPEKEKRRGGGWLTGTHLKLSSALRRAQDKQIEALAGGAAFALQNQYLIHLQERHSDLSYEVYDPGAGRKNTQNQILLSLNFACKNMGKMNTIEEVERSPLWENARGFCRPAFSQVVRLISSCSQCKG